MKNSNPLEKYIETKVCEHAKKLGCLVYKFTSPSRRSVPDRLFIMPDGKGTFFIEFKRKGAKCTPAQEIEIEKIRKQGQEVLIVDNVTTGLCFISDMLNPGTFFKENRNLQPRKRVRPQLKMDDPFFN